MIILNRQFKPSWLMLFIMVIAIALFVSLGMWQLERAAYKSALEAQYESLLSADYVDFNADQNTTAMAYQKVILTGTFDVERTMLLDNRLDQGRAGYHVVSPFQLASGEFVLINRGWIAATDSRAVLPIVDVPIDLTRVKGIVNLPADNVFQMGELTLTEDWPQVIPFIDFAALQPLFSGQLLPIVVWLGVDQSGHYARNWQPIWSKPEKSEAYALQWFSFALISFILFFVLNLRKLHD